MRGDASCDAGVFGIDRDGVGGGARVLVVGDHLGEVEFRGALWGYRRTDQSGRVPDHEGHLVGGHGVGGDDKVRFILAMGVVEDYDEVAGA